MRGGRPRAGGMTLVELVVAIVVISIAVAGVLAALTQATRHGADPMLTEQAVAIAQSYLEEITLAAYADPDGETGCGPEAGETRATYDDVCDYNGLNDASGAVDRNGNPIAGLEAYNVQVSVADATLNGVAGRRIEVRVTHDNAGWLDVKVAGWRMSY